MAQTIAQLKQTRLLIRFHCNQMINLRGMKKCYPCMEFKQRELNNEYSWLTCFLIINQDLPTTDIWTPPPPLPPIQTLFLHKAKQGRWLCAVATHKVLPLKNCALIHHESAKSFRHGQSLISSPSYGYCDVFCGKFFGKFLVPSNLTCAQETRWLRDSVRFFGPIQTPNFSCT